MFTDSMYLIVLTLLLKSLGATFAKFAAITSYDQGAMKIVFNIWFLLEIASLGLMALTWTMVLRKIKLSIAYPFMSLNYGLTLFIAWFIFQETVTLNNILGVLVIISGVILLAPQLSEDE